ncbi:hypothetical protein RFI_30708 [Reticulomyxa filosa]|uniref:Carbohydrate kinase PfkB domain-containing protein n=1 Tax=Reticulomyxa filosa TaxID=46433 RepID=X6LZT9_RETFI|nr:hypothetical protein RFI_30708 [Reticulomyxa filosa]|eukprot:ETO06682.1 hypothetical protein RFI_30708 [Reticulomyxa filosa]
MSKDNKEVKESDENKQSNVCIVVCGGINIDRFFNVARLPVAAAKAGANAYFIGAFGNDVFTSYLKETMDNYKVDTTGCYTLKKDVPCGQAYIFLLPEKDNSIVVIPSANAQWPDDFNDTQRSIIESADCILLQRVEYFFCLKKKGGILFFLETYVEVPEEYNLRISKIAHKKNIPVILDMGGEDSPVSKELLQYVSIVSPNESELRRLVQDEKMALPLTSEGMKVIHDKLNQYNDKLHILLKLGSQGCQMICSKYNYYHILSCPALPLQKDQVVDTTGAGDCFTGAFAAQWIRELKAHCRHNNISHPSAIFKWADWDDTVKYQLFTNAMKFACTAAGLSVTKLGTMTSFPSLQEVVETNHKWSLSNK